ncbi:PREDICTED: uncharacterized protein LOC106338845 [Brassica oleracea var. oleracea]|uniref:uncharacterized protein LOC106338845 n=1 Tax=Brassica oleracea var. oleracea TaxID=109376 RepID=UPI0006A6F154|nr:PREDICTED: uncharacterized protein LOC106338845 [Brassica oleracea var. oleracea]
MMNEDLILDIMSCCPATEISKFRLLNKACNKRSYEFHFINHHLHKTNSVLGYFIQDHKKHRRPGFVVFGGAEEEAPEKPRIALEIPDYIVCKPTTKQYRIIPNPKSRYFTIAIGLMVIQSNPFRYKIVRVSEPLPWERRKTSEGFNNLYCEVFDSDTYAWKRLNDLELRSDEFLRRSEKPESSYGLLHWLTGKNNVIQFCMQTETWSFFPLPEDVIGDGSSLDLVSYEGKLAVLCSNSNSRGGYDLWALDNSSGKSWANVKDVQVTDLEDKYAKPLWFLSNDVILVAGFVRLGLYNTNSNKFQYLHKTTQECLPYYLPRDYNIVTL